jgi:hypothetical protein
MKNLDERALVRAAAENEDIVVTGGRQVASRVARQAGEGRRPVHHDAHRSAGEGARPHYHPQGRTGHVFYSAAAAVTVSNYVAEDASKAVKVGAAVIDFFNPLSIAKDALDIVGDVQEMISSGAP